MRLRVCMYVRVCVCVCVCVCVYECTYFIAQGTDPFAFRNGPQPRILAVGVAFFITLITKQHLRREREGERERGRERERGPIIQRKARFV